MHRRIMALAFAAVGLALAAPVQAQGPGGGFGPNLDEQMAELTEQLELTDEQAVDVRKILEMQAEKRREAFQNGGGDRSAMRAVMQEMREETNARLAEVLDEAQMAKYEEIEAERMQRRGPPPFSARW